ncbi:hypothetical protein J4558_08230 [Leptolyngbya sp. 15MV]|nr:hypothetical protein J4558_08230 [Leptolyngbya sp. 15MV]
MTPSHLEVVNEPSRDHQPLRRNQQLNNSLPPLHRYHLTMGSDDLSHHGFERASIRQVRRRQKGLNHIALGAKPAIGAYGSREIVNEAVGKTRGGDGKAGPESSS